MQRKSKALWKRASPIAGFSATGFSLKLGANRGYRDKGSADEKGGYCRVAVRRPVEYCYGV
jgi:hypothetical protein